MLAAVHCSCFVSIRDPRDQTCDLSASSFKPTGHPPVLSFIYSSFIALKNDVTGQCNRTGCIFKKFITCLMNSEVENSFSVLFP